MLGIVLIGVLLLTMVVAFVMTVYQAPHLSRLRDANVLVQLFANLAVAFYAFPHSLERKDGHSSRSASPH